MPGLAATPLPRPEHPSVSATARPPAVPEPCLSCDARADSVCNAVDDEHIARLAEVAVVTTVEPGQTFIEEGDPADAFFNLTAGSAKLYKLMADGRRQITGFVARGHFLGLAVSDTYAFSAEATERVRLCRFTRAKMFRLLADFPALERRLLERAATELVAAQEQMLLLGRKTARERVASFLVAQAAAAPCGRPRAVLHLPMSRGDIADYLGLTIETVSRTLSRLRADRLIEIPNATTLVIRDPGRLVATASG
ncbi:MAG: Crp/Fnr family transcriptional regulator [Rhodospirillales bacterium]|nr:Crp/Fnr family transcriptional regulator [Rhodospirillales bacterium]